MLFRDRLEVWDPGQLSYHLTIPKPKKPLVSVRVKEDGSCITDTFEKRRSMKICRALEKDFKLTHLPIKQNGKKCFYCKRSIMGKEM